MSVLGLEGGAIVEIRAQPNTKPYPSGARTVQTGGAYKSVEPDGVAPLLVAIRTQKPKGITLVNYKESIFYDAKAVVGRISLSVENYQALGFVDALTQSDAGKLYNTPKVIRPTPRLIYLTTSDTIIGNSTIEKATREGVALFQHVVCDNIPNGGTLGTNDIVMGKGIPLNFGIYKGKPTPSVPLKPGLPSTLGPLLPQAQTPPLSPPSDGCFKSSTPYCPGGCCI